jgi:acetoacetate decarboxylase
MATHPAPDLWEVQGQSIDLPVTVENARFAGALWRASRSAVDAQLEPYGLRSAGFRGSGLAMLVCVVYPEEFVLGGYDEVGIGVFASGPGGPGLFVLELPVTGTFTREAGREIWGLPKWLMTSTADLGGSRSTMVMSDGDVPVMNATIRTGAMPMPWPVPSAGHTWARAEDGPLASRLLRGKTSMRFHRLRLGRGRGTTITWGEHRMADRARALGMDGRPFATFSAERLTASFGESRVVDD